MAIRIQENVPLAPLTTFKIGGSARYFAEAHSEEEIREALAVAHDKNIPAVIMGGGSNVLVPDEGLNALVVFISLMDFKLSGKELEAGAGCNLLSLIKEASYAGMGGWEKLAGIPGTIGGAVRGNAGAFGTEIKDFPVKIRALNSETAEIKEFQNADCDFAYRHSFFKDNPKWIIVHVQIHLRPIPTDISVYSIQETIAEREKRHLQNVQAAGSYFMNPVAPREVQELFETDQNQKSREDRVPAGWLIEKAGMKGARVGGAIASLQHPNYIVNEGGATAREVKQLAEDIKKAVAVKFGVQLKEEAIVLG